MWQGIGIGTSVSGKWVCTIKREYKNFAHTQWNALSQ